MNNVKDIVNLFRAWRTEDTQKGPDQGTMRVRGRLAMTPIKSNPAPLQIYVKDFWFATWMIRWLISSSASAAINRIAQHGFPPGRLGEVASIEAAVTAPRRGPS